MQIDIEAKDLFEFKFYQVKTMDESDLQLYSHLSPYDKRNYRP